MGIVIPGMAHEVIAALESCGFSAFVVGGAVRDALLGRAISDVDIATSSTVDETTACLEAHGTVTAICDDEAFEVTTFRIDGPYSDSRHPDSVEFSDSISDDLARRDFTINAMAYNPKTGLVDPFGGQADLAAGIIRCVGNPDVRFGEDALRIIRALRFSAQLGFDIEEQTAESLLDNRELLSKIADERIGKEFCGVVMSDKPGRVFGDYVDVFIQIIPQIAPIVGLETGAKHHIYDVWTHTLVAMDSMDTDDLATRLAVFFHDMGKPDVDDPEKGDFRFAGHAFASANICSEVLGRFALPKSVIEEACAVIAAHDYRFDPTNESVRHWMGKLGVDVFFKTIDLKKADILAHSPDMLVYVARMDEIAECARESLARGECHDISGLAVDGNDLKTIGYTQGPQIGEALSWLLEQVISGNCSNSHDDLLDALRQR